MLSALRSRGHALTNLQRAYATAASTSALRKLEKDGARILRAVQRRIDIRNDLMNKAGAFFEGYFLLMLACLVGIKRCDFPREHCTSATNKRTRTTARSMGVMDKSKRGRSCSSCPGVCPHLP